MPRRCIQSYNSGKKLALVFNTICGLRSFSAAMRLRPQVTAPSQVLATRTPSLKLKTTRGKIQSNQTNSQPHQKSEVADSGGAGHTVSCLSCGSSSRCEYTSWPVVEN